MAQRRDFSEETAEEIDDEIKKIVTENYARAKKLLESNMGALHRLARALLEKEILDAVEIDRLIHSDDGEGPKEPHASPDAKPESLKPEDAARLGVLIK